MKIMNTTLIRLAAMALLLLVDGFFATAAAGQQQSDSLPLVKHDAKIPQLAFAAQELDDALREAERVDFVHPLDEHRPRLAAAARRGWARK